MRGTCASPGWSSEAVSRLYHGMCVGGIRVLHKCPGGRIRAPPPTPAPPQAASSLLGRRCWFPLRQRPCSPGGHGSRLPPAATTAGWGNHLHAPSQARTAPQQKHRRFLPLPGPPVFRCQTLPEKKKDGSRRLSPVVLRGLAFQVRPKSLQQCWVQLLSLIKHEQGLAAALLRLPHLV